MFKHHHLETGSSLIEVLITLLVFAVGMLGMAALQLNALQGSSDSAQRSQSTWILQDIAERIRANPAGTAANYAAAPACAAVPLQRCADFYNPATAAKVNATDCNAAQMAAFDRWEAQCSYSAIAGFNTIDGRFTGRDFIIAPADAITLTVVSNVADAARPVNITGFWLGKADNAKGAGEHISNTSTVEVVR
ncbi:MAG: type IV pilus modification protein PilV [Pseudomonadaceae bacterium]|nr:type IV pilus modification protein PilV [Pseudomonadaceae bacterium]